MNSHVSFFLALVMMLCLISACDKSSPVAEKVSEPSVYFEDVTKQAGLDFIHVNGASKRKYLPEIMGSGGSVLDFDNDGWMDIYLVQSGHLPGSEVKVKNSGNRLYRNLGDGSFADVTENAGVADKGYGMGAVSADYNNDGYVDIYVLNMGANVLFRNNGDGTFTDVTQASGVEDTAWSSSATFFDANRDGFLDLYVVNYMEFSVHSHVDCGTPSKGIFSYCSPDVYPMAADRFFRGLGDGTFEDATQAVGMFDATGHGKGLGVVAVDVNNDQWPDLYVSNDSTPNYLWLNQGDGTFEESGIMFGVSHNENGVTEAGMGVDAGDVNADGLMDLFVTNLSGESNSLYLADTPVFQYHTKAAGLYEDSFIVTGFGTDLLDIDNDTDLDLFIANGHVLDNIALSSDVMTFHQPSQLFLNNGSGQFSLVDADHSGPIAEPAVARGTLTLDFDNDGWLDLLVTYNNAKARLFRNIANTGNNWVGFQLLAKNGKRSAIGSKVTLSVGEKTLIEYLKAGASYQTSSDPRIHFGLGHAGEFSNVEVQWPNGERQQYSSLASGQYHPLMQLKN